jgi:hypothetical protein
MGFVHCFHVPLMLDSMRLWVGSHHLTILALLSISLLQGVFMKFVMTALVSAFMLVSMPAFAGAHGGGKMDDKKVDCSKKENEKNPACVKK